MLSRIDERTETLVKTLNDHVVQDREDFKTLTDNVSKIAGKQNWFMGLLTAVAAVLGFVTSMIIGGLPA